MGKKKKKAVSFKMELPEAEDIGEQEVVKIGGEDTSRIDPNAVRLFQ